MLLADNADVIRLIVNALKGDLAFTGLELGQSLCLL